MFAYDNSMGDIPQPSRSGNANSIELYGCSCFLPALLEFINKIVEERFSPAVPKIMS